MTQQVLYLDFDGVLHPAPVYRHHKRGIYFGVEHSGHKLFENVSALVAALAPYPAVSVVLSTSWVHVLGYSRARSFLPEPLRSRVVGATFHSRMNKLEFATMPRGHQVLADATRRGVTAWLALDDDEDGWLTSAPIHLVLTDKTLGIQEPKVAKALTERLKIQFGS
ncbi:hypothetical protein H9K76_03265 [Diaphorobacter ruginosibacter]|uniref:Uncharacterized protein n=1 Tax=Diaphorobacter ruginosibacter TaxID=1715720 RepID=A0A7G9RQN6_9BURK|nr:HAD domain-containing protein [Diaphorobacter ruginosibacter]QNN57911.1 hypothetical protein H9K76_03265 [Diaphorobacter ruginosibacter]